MSVTVKHLNADSTFLLTFSPYTNPTAAELKSENGAYTVLIDPWLVGDSVVSARWFAITKHVIPSHIQHLSQIEEPDVAVISQNKPDHCHKQTLLQLNPAGKTIIAAEPGAAKAIRSWNHFDPNRVYALRKYDPEQRFENSLRLRIPPLAHGGRAGELSISFIPAKNYMTGLHNAFGITYQPPTDRDAVATVPTFDIPGTQQWNMPLTPSTMPASSPPGSMSRAGSLNQSLETNSAGQRPHTAHGAKHRPRLSRSSNTASSEFLPSVERPSIDSQQSSVHFDMLNTTSNNKLHPYLHVPVSVNINGDSTQAESHTQISPFTPPESPLRNTSAATSSASIASQLSNPLRIYSRRRRKSLPSTTASPNLRASISFPHLRATASNPPTSHLQQQPLSPTVIHPTRPKPISILYTPHGIPAPDLKPYITNHLANLSALPLTLLFHSFDTVNNPWFLGGNISAGAASTSEPTSPTKKSKPPRSRPAAAAEAGGGGVSIAQTLMSRVWISAHDEPKDDRGFAVRLTKTRRMGVAEVKRLLWMGREGEELRKRGWNCDVRSLGVGGEVRVSSGERDFVGVGGPRGGEGLGGAESGYGMFHGLMSPGREERGRAGSGEGEGEEECDCGHAECGAATTPATAPAPATNTGRNGSNDSDLVSDEIPLSMRDVNSTLPSNNDDAKRRTDGVWSENTRPQFERSASGLGIGIAQ